MNDTLDLERRLAEIAASAPTPEVPLAEDLGRGRRRLRRQRLLTTGGTIAGVAVIALGVGLARGTMDGPGDVRPADRATQSASPTPRTPATADNRTGAELLQDYRDVLAEHLDPEGTHLQKQPGNVQSGRGLGTRLGWSVPGKEGLGMVEVFVGSGWNAFVGTACGDPSTECSRTSVDGIDARIIEWNGSTTVVVKDAGGTVAITVNALFGNNSLVPVEGMDIPLDDVIRAAADDRLTQPTPAQMGNVHESMGFPRM